MQYLDLLFAFKSMKICGNSNFWRFNIWELFRWFFTRANCKVELAREWFFISHLRAGREIYSSLCEIFSSAGREIYSSLCEVFSSSLPFLEEYMSSRTFSGSTNRGASGSELSSKKSDYWHCDPFFDLRYEFLLFFYHFENRLWSQREKIRLH